MAVALTTNPGGLFTRLGKLFGMANDIKTHQLDIRVEVDDILDQYNNDRDIANILQTQAGGFVTGAGGPMRSLQTIARNTMIEMLHDDSPLPSKTFDLAIRELIIQMTASSDSINGTTVSSVEAAGASNIGNGQLIVGLVDHDNHALEYARAEVIDLKCTSDAQISGTAGRETFSIKGEAPVSDNLSPDWPAGSGLSSSIVLTDPSVDGGNSVGVNNLTNSDFEDFVAGSPTGWTIDTGAAGGTVDETTTFHRGAKALQITGNGAELTEISQSISLKLNKVMAMSFWIRHDGIAPAAGVLRVSIQDSGGTVMNASSSLVTASKSVTLSGISSTYALQTLVFQTPTQIPVGAKVVVELTTAMTSPRAVFIDGLTVCEMKQVGAKGSPFVIMVPGATDHIIDDTFTITVTNNNEGAFVRKLDQFYNLYASGIYIPSNTAGGETILDSLIS